MSVYERLLAAVKYVRDRTGDPNAWQTGLTPNEVTAVITPTTRPEQIETILAKIRQQHSAVFGDLTPSGRSGGWPPAETAVSDDQGKGAAAEAIAHAEAALAHQNSASSQLDMQVVSAILNAHLKTVDGREALTKLQRETEAAVQTRSDLDTPTGARDFQRFLIGKLRDIRAVVLNANLDDTSKSALMAAWTSLYAAAKHQPNGVGDGQAGAASGLAAPARAIPQHPTDDVDIGWDPLLDALLAGDAGPVGGDGSPVPPAAAAAPAMPIPPMLPPLPGFGGGSGPGLGAAPGALSGWGAPGGPPLSALKGEADPARAELDDEALPESSDSESGNPEGDSGDHHAAEAAADAPPARPTTVTLPDGETVTAASPQLAAAIEAAVGGAPIADAFQQQGVTIPAPGSAVASPIDPLQVIPGDIGIFTDRHALALGTDKALLDGQIQHIATVSGPSFLGWQHPPAGTATATAPAKPDTPTPTRPATSSAT